MDMTTDRYDIGSGNEVPVDEHIDASSGRIDLNMNRRTALRGVAAAGFVGSGLLSFGAMPVGAANGGGPVVLMGVDAEDGGIGGHGPISVYVSVVNDILSNASNGGAGILVLGSNGSDPEAFWDEISSQTGEAVTYVSGAVDITNEDFSGYAMIGVVSSAPETSGGMTQVENDALVARAADVATFVNDGGGLLGFSQTDFTNAWDYLGSIGAFVTETDLFYSDIVPTAEGLAIGITDDLDITAWHDTFTDWPDFLEVLAWRAGFVDVEAAALGGAQIVIEVCEECEAEGALAKYEFECVETDVEDECVAWDFVLEGEGDDNISYTAESFESKDGEDFEPMTATFETTYCDLYVLVKSGKELEVQSFEEIDGSLTVETANDGKFAISFVEFYCTEAEAEEALESFPSKGKGN